MLKIIGAKGCISNVEIFLNQVGNFAKNNSVVIQVFDADMIYGKKHLVSSVEHAIRAMNRGTNTTNSLDMEILLYASGERQLKIAIPKMGVKKGKGNIAFVFTNNDIPNHLTDELLKLLSLEREDSVLEGNENTIKNFGITEVEMKTVTKSKYKELILEKVAMVDVIK